MTVGQIKTNMGVGELHDWFKLAKIESEEAKKRERETRMANRAAQNRKNMNG